MPVTELLQTQALRSEAVCHTKATFLPRHRAPSGDEGAWWASGDFCRGQEVRALSPVVAVLRCSDRARQCCRGASPLSASVLDLLQAAPRDPQALGPEPCKVPEAEEAQETGR